MNPTRHLFWRKAWLGLGVLLLAGAPCALCADAPTLNSANQAYAEGQFENAATQYRELIAQKGYSANLCFNLGNAEAKAGHHGPALLQYERARYLAPRDAQIDHNLQLARAAAGLEPNSLRWWQVLLRDLTPLEWALLVDFWLALIAVAVLLQAMRVYQRQNGHVEWVAAGRPIKSILFISIPAFLLSGYLALIASPTRIEGVVTGSGAILRLSPFASAESLGPIPEGELVTVEQRHRDYVRIEARDHRYGWLSLQEIEPIIPGSFGARGTKPPAAP